MKLLIISIILFASSLLFLPASSMAASHVFGFCNQSGANPAVCSDAQSAASNPTVNPVISVLKTVINVISLILGIVAVVVIIISGFRMVLGGSDPSTISSSRDAIIYAAIGILVAVFAQAIVVFVLDKLK